MLPDLNQKQQTATSLDQFDIRNHINSLTPTKTKGKYICPVCNGNDLSIDDNTGKYQCWHGCDCAEIREAIAPWDEVKGGQRRSPTKIIPDQKKSPPKPAPLPEVIELATLPSPVEHPQKVQKGNKSEIIYPYSDHQWVVRIDKEDGKITIPYHIDSEGNEVNKKGDSPWTAYRMDEALEHGKGKFIFGVEGEKCVEAGRYLGLVTLTWQGGSWTDEDLQATFTALKNAGVLGIIYHPDHDGCGERKGLKALKNANAVGFPCLILDPLEVYPHCSGMGGDLADFISEMKGEFTKDDYMGYIERAIASAVKARQKAEKAAKEKRDEESMSKGQRLKLEIQRYIAENDIFERQTIKTEIQSAYKTSNKDFSALVAALEVSTIKPQWKFLTPNDIFTMENAGLKWLIPGVLPAAGVTVLGGDSGVGKSTIAYDCAASIIYGDEFLGETPTITGKVLFVSSDEPLAFSQDKLINRGIEENFAFLSDWTVNNWDALEKAMEATNPSLVVVDSFASIHSDGEFDENSAQAKATIYQLNRLLSRHNSAAILIHHCNKSKENKGVNKLRGSTAIAAASSMVWLLEGEGEVKHFWQPKTRGTEPLKLKIQLDAPTGHYNVVGGQIDDDSTKSLSDRVLEMFESLPAGIRLETGEILEKIPCERDTLYKALNRLVKRGMLIKRPSQKNKRHKVFGLPVLQDNETGHTPPQHCYTDVQCEATTNIEKELQTLDTTLDTHWTSTGHEKGEISETLIEPEIKTLDTHAGQGGGVCVETEKIDTHITDTTVDYSTFPSPRSNDPRHLRNRAEACKAKMLNCTNNTELQVTQTDGEYGENEIRWVIANLFTDSDVDQLAVIMQTEQPTIPGLDDV